MIPNFIRNIIGKYIYKIFDPIFNLYYKYGSSSPPKKYYYKLWLKNPEIYEWDYLHYGEFVDPVCFPLIFNINCIGCHGCANNKHPFLGTDPPKGPWKVVTTELFNDNYEELFGKEALVDLLFNLEKHNEEVDKMNSEDHE